MFVSPLVESENASGAGHSAPTATELDRLVREHIPLVGHIVRDMMSRLPSHVSREDLTSAGLVALVTAIRGFDASRGVPLARYAAQRIRGAILDELRGLDWASRSVRRRQRELDQVRATLAATLGRSATTDEVAAATGMTQAEVASHDDDVARASVVSLQSFTDTPIDELLPARDPDAGQVLVERERVAYLRDAVAVLPERLRRVVEGYFFAERPMAELAAELGVTESRISQMRAEALSLLREGLHRVYEAPASVPVSAPSGVAERRRAAYVSAIADHRSFTARLSEPTTGTGRSDPAARDGREGHARGRRTRSA